MNTSLVIFELMTLLVPPALIALLFFVVRGTVSGGVRDAMSAGDSRENAGGEPSAREVLDRRYASGELSREEYLNIRDEITRDRDA